MTENTAIAIPDLVGDQGRAEIVASAIRDLQVQQENLRIQQTLNESGDDDTVPGLNLTYAQRDGQIEDAIQRLAEMNPQAIRAIIESQQKG